MLEVALSGWIPIWRFCPMMMRQTSWSLHQLLYQWPFHYSRLPMFAHVGSLFAYEWEKVFSFQNMTSLWESLEFQRDFRNGKLVSRVLEWFPLNQQKSNLQREFGACRVQNEMKHSRVWPITSPEWMWLVISSPGDKLDGFLSPRVHRFLSIFGSAFLRNANIPAHVCVFFAQVVQVVATGAFQEYGGFASIILFSIEKALAIHGQIKAWI